MPPTHRKKKGEWAESAFLTRALSLGFHVSQPWGDTAPYDFIVDKPTLRPLRVQIKSAWRPARRNGKRFMFRATGCFQRSTYTAADVDFLACLVVPLDLWYIVPIAAITPNQSFLYVAPDAPATSPLTLASEPYREAWGLLEEAGSKFVIRACAEEYDEAVIGPLSSVFTFDDWEDRGWDVRVNRVQ